MVKVSINNMTRMTAYAMSSLDLDLGDCAITKGLLMVVSKRWFEFCPETKFLYPLF